VQCTNEEDIDYTVTYVRRLGTGAQPEGGPLPYVRLKRGRVKIPLLTTSRGTNAIVADAVLI